VPGTTVSWYQQPAITNVAAGYALCDSFTVRVAQPATSAVLSFKHTLLVLFDNLGSCFDRLACHTMYLIISTFASIGIIQLRRAAR